MTDEIAPIRRVVTGHDDHGQSYIHTDEMKPVTRAPAPGLHSFHIWATDQMPVQIDTADDGAATLSGIAPRKDGTRIGILHFEPGTHASLHRTQTLDYAVCLSGEIEMELDRDRVVLRPGDVVIQRGTNHAWTNRGPGAARLLFVLIDGQHG